MKIDIKGIKPEKHLFHNEILDVHRKNIKFKEITFWAENYRTLLHFDILEDEKKKPISELSLKEITTFLAGRSELKIEKLAASISKNGVKVPLVILTDGLLLDGNRRYFACSYLFHKSDATLSSILDSIPVYIIKKKDVDERIKRKILAEANFVDDYKVPWTLDVKAKMIGDFYNSCIKNKLTSDQAYEEVQDVFSVKKIDVDTYLDTMKLTEEFILKAPESKKNNFREIVQHKFVYFWEFRNKAFRGGSQVMDLELTKVKKLFFEIMKLQRFKNLKQVEPMIRSVRDEYTWDLLSTSKGAKMDMVEAIIKEQRAVKSAEDKVRNFLKWLQNKAELSSFTKSTFTLLGKLGTECKKLIKKGKV